MEYVNCLCFADFEVIQIIKTIKLLKQYSGVSDTLTTQLFSDNCLFFIFHYVFVSQVINSYTKLSK